MATSKIPSSAATARLTPTDRLMQAHEDNVRLAAENAAYRERERLAAETPQPIPVATPAAAAVPPIRSIRPVVETDRDYWLGRIVAALVVVALLATGIYLYSHGLFPFSGNLVVVGGTTPPATVVVETPAPKPELCDTSCLKIKLHAACPSSDFDFDGRTSDGISSDKLLEFYKESKNCPVVTPVKVDVPEPRPLIKERVVYRDKVIIKYKTPTVRHALPPVVEVAEEDAPVICPDEVATNCRHHNRQQRVVSGTCYIQVSVRSAGNGYPANRITAWADGGGIRGTIRGSARPHDGMVQIPVDCGFAYGDKGQVCFGNEYAMARNLNEAWFAVAQRNLSRGQRVLNAGSSVGNLWFADDGS